MIKRTLLSGISILMIWGCGHKKEECAVIPDVSGIHLDLDYRSLSDTLVRLKSREGLSSFLGRYPVFRDYFLNREGYPNDSVFIDAWFRRFTHPAMDTLVQEVHRVFGDESTLKQQFTEAFMNLKFYYPDFKPPVIRTVVSGLESDMFVSDSVILVGLDFYLGKDAKYRPRVYNYIMNQYVPELVVPSCMMLCGIREPYNATNFGDQTALADMIAYGKSFTFAKRMLPCVPDSVFLWYTAGEMKIAKENEDKIWERMIADEVLYTTNHITKEHYLGPRPATLEISNQCPGRIAQWIGWEIVRKYMQTHPETTLQELMRTSDAEKIFKESGYRPVH